MARRLLPMYDLDKPVGAGMPNLPADVRLIQTLVKSMQTVNDFLTEGLPPVNVTGTYGPELGEAIRKIQMTAKKHGGGNVVDGIIHPLPSRSGLAGDWDRNFRNGVSSTLSFLCYRLFRFSRDAYMKVGDTLNLAWSPDPFEM